LRKVANRQTNKQRRKHNILVGRGNERRIVCGKSTYDVEHSLATGSRVIGQRVVRRTAQRSVTVVRCHVTDVQVAVRHDAETVA